MTGLLGTAQLSTGQLAGALRYALAVVGPVTDAQLTEPTPCREWDLRALLLHAGDSVAALSEGLCAGRVSLDPPVAVPAGDPAGAFSERASRLLARCEASPEPSLTPSLAQRAGTAGEAEVLIADCPLARGLLCSAGAIEIAVHAWDVSQACGTGRPVPELLARDLLRAATELICADERAPQFAMPRHVPATASASDRLAAFLGR